MNDASGQVPVFTIYARQDQEFGTILSTQMVRDAESADTRFALLYYLDEVIVPTLRREFNANLDQFTEFVLDVDGTIKEL